MPIQKPFAVLPLPLTNITTGNQRSNRPASHLALPQYPGMVWQSNGSGSLFVRGQFGGPMRAINFASLMGTNAQPGTWWRVKLGTSQADVDSVTPSYDSGAIAVIDPARIRADGIYHGHHEIPALRNASWWRIDVSNHIGDFSASALIFGQKREPARFYNRDREIGFEDLGALEISRNGVVAETDGVVLRTLLCRLQWVSDDEFASLWAPLMSVKGKRQLIYWCLDPQADDKRQDNTFLGYMARELFRRGNDFPKDNQVDVQLRALNFSRGSAPVLPIAGGIPEPSLTLDFGHDGAVFVRTAADVVAQPRTFSPFITFTRASTATRVNAAGLIETVAANVPRFDYDPVTLQPRGLLVEAGRTNLLLRSAEFDNASWSKSGSGTGIAPVVTANAGAAPDGTMSADRIQLNLAGGSTLGDRSQIAQNVNYSAVDHVFSVWLRSNTAGDQTALLLNFNNQSGVITITPEWQRFTLLRTATALASVAGIRLRGGVTGDTADILVWGAQLEAGAFASSYIPTTGAPVTRAADVAVVTGGNFSDWHRQDEGALLAEAESRPSGNFAGLTDGTSNNRSNIAAASSGLVAEVVFGGVAQASFSAAPGGTLGVLSKRALAYRVNDFCYSQDGSIATDTSGTTPVVDRLVIGGLIDSDLFGHIRRIRYWPQRLSNAQLQELTA